MVLTNDQIEFRQKILNKKIKVKKERPLPTPPKEPTRIDYMNNCVFWVNEYAAGRTDEARFKKAVYYLREYCNEILGW